jgi:hypothetical protein
LVRNRSHAAISGLAADNRAKATLSHDRTPGCTRRLSRASLPPADCDALQRHHRDLRQRHRAPRPHGLRLLLDDWTAPTGVEPSSSWSAPMPRGLVPAPQSQTSHCCLGSRALDRPGRCLPQPANRSPPGTSLRPVGGRARRRARQPPGAMLSPARHHPRRDAARRGLPRRPPPRRYPATCWRSAPRR